MIDERGAGEASASPALSRREQWRMVRGALITGLARSVLLTVLSLLVWAAAPSAWGWVPTTVMSDSMSPGIHTGDVVVAMPLDPTDIQPGQDVLVHDPDHADRLRFHRFVEFDDAGRLVLRGDANQTNDSSPVDREDVIGIGVLRVPYIGLPVVWLRTTQLAPLLAVIVALMALVTLAGRDPERRAVPGPARSRRKRGARILVGAIAFGAVALAVGAAALASTPAHSAYSKASPNPGANLTAAGTYDCLSPAVADSPYLLFRFNETSGTTVADSSGNGRSGTLVGGATLTPGSCTAGASPALALSGSSGYVSTATSLAAPNVFSLELWFRTTSTSGGRLFGFSAAATGTSASTDRQLYLTNAGAVAFGVDTGSTKIAVTSATGLNNGAWHHAVATMSSAGTTLYIDGAKVAANTSVTSGRTFTGYLRAGGDTLTGWPSVPTSSTPTATIDGVAGYGAALTAAQIASHYSAGH